MPTPLSYCSIAWKTSRENLAAGLPGPYPHLDTATARPTDHGFKDFARLPQTPALGVHAEPLARCGRMSGSGRLFVRMQPSISSNFTTNPVLNGIAAPALWRD